MEETPNKVYFQLKMHYFLAEVKEMLVFIYEYSLNKLQGRNKLVIKTITRNKLQERS